MQLGSTASGTESERRRELHPLVRLRASRPVLNLPGDAIRQRVIQRGNQGCRSENLYLAAVVEVGGEGAVATNALERSDDSAGGVGQRAGGHRQDGVAKRGARRLIPKCRGID
jgi:hypothetical protein